MNKQYATHSAILGLMRSYDIQPKKGLGQNFLTDPRVTEKIIAAAQITSNDYVIEIGAGLGGLTQVLANNAKAVLAIELDRNLVKILQDLFADKSNVEVLQGDILKAEIGKLMEERSWQTAKIAANLPYYISTPVIMDLLEGSSSLSVITVMVQREVGERLIAKPGSKEYGALSLAAAYYADVTLSAHVPRNCFFPRPNVDSAVVTLRLRTIDSDPDLKGMLFKCIKAAFGNRRKTLVNCLRAQDWVQNDRQALIEIVKGCGFNENIRGEALSLDEFTHLAHKLRHSGITSFP